MLHGGTAFVPTDALQTNTMTRVRRLLPAMLLMLLPCTAAEPRHALVIGNSAYKNARALVNYAGHGVQIKGQNYLVPIDANMTAEYEVPDETLAMDTVVRALAETKSKLNIFVLDCCRDDPFARG